MGGDWNAKPGNDHENNHCLGQYAKYRSISSNGTYLLDFCNRLGLLLASTLFPHPQRHKTTWVAPPRPGYRHPTRNQIDFCIVKGVHRCMLLDSCSYSGTATSSDHFMVVTRMKLHILNSSSKYRSTRAELCNRHYDVANLVSKEEVQLVFGLRLAETLTPIVERLEEGTESVEELWTSLKNTIHEVAMETVRLALATPLSYTSLAERSPQAPHKKG